MKSFMDRREKPFLSVLIPAFNEADRIRKAIGSVRSATAAVGLNDFEIIVCDNNSTDETGVIAKKAGARVVFEPHNQIARARNRAAEIAEGEWLIFLDADSRLSPQLLEATLSMMCGGKVGAGGALLRFDRTDLPRHASFGLGIWNTTSRLMRWAAGSYVFCLRQAWIDTGGFSEEWYAGEEVAFSRLLKKWCRRRKLKFAIVTKVRLQTSSRKVEDHTVWETVSLVARLALPGALKKRSSLDYWYDRKG